MTHRPHPLLWIAIGLSLGMGLVNLGAVGFGNSYFSAALWSMSQSTEALLFAGLDPAGYVSVDKPPLGFWIQALSLKILGEGSYGLLLPTALSATLSAYVLHRILSPTFGPRVGALGALLMGTAPITIAVSRHNTHDAFVVLFLLIGAWCLQRGCATGKGWPYLLSGALIGAAFNIKMGLALVCLPGFGVYYLATSKGFGPRALRDAALFVMSLVILGASWVVFVDTTPPDKRPYVGGSDNNTAFNLLIHKNTLRALPSFKADPPKAGAPPPPRERPSRGEARGDRPPKGDQDLMEVGAPGPLRLFNRQLGGQVTWLLPLAVLGFLSLFGRRRRDDDERGRGPLAQGLLWAGWLIPLILLFSITPRFHRHYLILLAPPTAALAAIGVEAFITAEGRGRLIAGLGSAVVVALIIWPFPSFRLLLFFPALGAALMALARRSTSKAPALKAAALGALFVPFVIWGSFPILTGGDADLPFAGPELMERRSISAPSSQMDPFFDYVSADDPGARFFAGTWDGRTAGHLMLALREPVMAIGGYNGRDRILQGWELGEWIRLGEVRHFLVGPPPKEQEGNFAVIQDLCEVVDRALWLPEVAVKGGRGGPPESLKLYRCH